MVDESSDVIVVNSDQNVLTLFCCHNYGVWKLACFYLVHILDHSEIEVLLAVVSSGRFEFLLVVKNVIKNLANINPNLLKY